MRADAGRCHLPCLLRHRTEIQDVDHEKAAGLGAVDRDRTTQGVDDREVEVADVVGRVTVVDCSVESFAALEAELGARPSPRYGRDVLMPAVVRRYGWSKNDLD